MSDHDAILLEDMNHKLDALLEGQQAMAHVPSKLEGIDQRLGNVEADVHVIKLAVKAQTHDHRQLKKRVTHLEQAT